MCVNYYLFLSPLIIERIINIKNGIHSKFTDFQLVKEISIPADKLETAVKENTTKSLNPWALNFSSGVYVVTKRLVAVTKRKFHPIPKKINPNK